MKSGLLWYIANKATLTPEESISGAVVFYSQKYDGIPTHCHMNPKDHSKVKKPPLGITLVADASILSNHLWLGMKSQPTERKENVNI